MSTVFAGPAPNVLVAAIFVALLAAACVSDLRARRIPNALVVSLALLGFTASAAARPLLPGAALALGGMATGLALWLPFWLLRMVGAGDVKLFAAAAAWLGPSSAVEAALFTALFGGMIALATMLVRAGIGYTFLRLAQGVTMPGTLRDEPAATRAATLPYAVAITGGVCAAAWFPGVLV